MIKRKELRREVGSKRAKGHTTERRTSSRHVFPIVSLMIKLLKYMLFVIINLIYLVEFVCFFLVCCR